MKSPSATPSATPATPGYGRPFLSLWATQTLSMTGIGLSNFALGVWVYLETESVSLFVLLEIVAVLPGLVVSPFMGVLIDRFGPRLNLLLADVGGMVVTLMLAGLFLLEAASISWIFAMLILRNLLTITQMPAYTAATTYLVPSEKLSKAAALTQFGLVGQRVAAPALAGVFLVWLGIDTVVLINALIFIPAILVVFGLPLKRPPPHSMPRWHAQIKEAWAVIHTRHLLGFAGYTFVSYYTGGFVIALAVPLVLSVASPPEYRLDYVRHGHWHGHRQCDGNPLDPQRRQHDPPAAL